MTLSFPHRLLWVLKCLIINTHLHWPPGLPIKHWEHQDTPELLLTRPSPGLMLVKWTSSRHAHWLISGSVVDRMALSQMPFKVLACNENIQKTVRKILSWLLPLSVFKNVKEMSSKTTEIEDSFVQIHSTACLHPYCNTVQTTFPLVPPHQQMLTHPLSEKNPHKIQQKKVV